MPSEIRGVVQGGQIQLLDQVALPEGAKVLVTLISDDETQFWIGASQRAAAGIWDNPEDDVYAELSHGMT